MKEIIKYLRQINSYTQNDVAEKIGVSRQSYIKYENGSVTPSKDVVCKLSDLYGVEKDFIYKNEIPKISGKTDSFSARKNFIDYDSVDAGELDIASVVPDYTASKRRTKSYEAYYDGNCVRLLNTDYVIERGQHFTVIIEESDIREQRKKENAWDNIIELTKSVSPYNKGPDDDPFYKKELETAILEKYAPDYLKNNDWDNGDAK